MANVIFNVTSFNQLFPEFKQSKKFVEDSIIIMTNQTATLYVSNVAANNYNTMTAAQQVQALNYMTAHLLAIQQLIAAGNQPGVVKTATIDKINVTLELPELKDQWQWWLNITPYGQALFAMMSVAGVGGFYIGGSPEGSAFRKVGGIF